MHTALSIHTSKHSSPSMAGYWLNFNALAAAFALFTAGAAFAEDMRPDLNGTFTNMSLTGLTRPEGAEPLVVNADLAQQIADGTP
ncbi:MAG: hypothetical protein NWQ51_08700, partial [OM182 bacterium]|nr:hypothetical protein [OM182 bacterium]